MRLGGGVTLWAWLAGPTWGSRRYGGATHRRGGMLRLRALRNSIEDALSLLIYLT